MYNRGFTLVEVLIAVSLTALLFTGIIVIIGSAIQTGESGRKTLSELPANARLYTMLARLTARPAERVDNISTSSSTGGIWYQDNEYISIGSIAKNGYCANDPARILNFLQARIAPYPISSESRATGVYSLSNDGTQVYSEWVVILGTGVAGKSFSTPLLSEFESNSLVGSGSLLLLSDPRSDRILFYDTTNWGLSSWDLAKHGIFGATSLAFSGNYLVVGARNGGFKITSGVPRTSISTSFNGPPAGLTGIAGYRVQFDGIPTLSSPNNPNSSTLNCTTACLTINSSEDTLVLNGSGFTYSFTGSTQSILANTTLELNIPNIAPLPNTLGKYIAEFSFVDNSGVALWTTLIPFREIWDTNLWTLADNAIIQISNSPFIREVGGAFLSGSLDYIAQSWSGVQIFQSQQPIWELFIQKSSDGSILSFTMYDAYDCLSGTGSTTSEIYPIRSR